MMRPETLWRGLVLIGIVFFLSIKFNISWLSYLTGISLMFGAILWSAYAFVLYPHMCYEQLQKLKREE